MPVALAKEYPGLAYLLGAYLHQDFDIHGGTLADAVRAFGREEVPDVVAEALSDIRRLERTYPDRLEWALHALEHSFARPPGKDAGAFLHWLGDVLSEMPATGNRAAE